MTASDQPEVTFDHVRYSSTTRPSRRIAPVLPMIPGTPERRSHDYVRHGTIDLFAALNTAAGK